MVTKFKKIVFAIVACFSLTFCENKENHFKKNVSGVIEIAAFNEADNISYGTGWFLNENTIVTNYHVISLLEKGERSTFQNIQIRFYNKQDYEEISLIKFNEEKDVAFLSYGGNQKHSYIKTSDDYFPGSKCFEIGNFSNYGLSYKEGVISLKEINLFYNSSYSIFIQAQISIGQGDSGAPLFNENNKVIGMITFRNKGGSGTIEQCFAYAIPVSEIESLF